MVRTLSNGCSRAGESGCIKCRALPELGERYRIRSIPTMAIFEGGREAARTAGAMPAAEIERFVNGAVKVSSLR